MRVDDLIVVARIKRLQLFQKIRHMIIPWNHKNPSAQALNLLPLRNGKALLIEEIKLNFLSVHVAVVIHDSLSDAVIPHPCHDLGDSNRAASRSAFSFHTPHPLLTFSAMPGHRMEDP